MNLLNACSKSKLPELDYYYLNYVPADSEEVRLFMKNSIPIQNKFFFNTSCQEQVEGSKYIKEIKTVAKKTLEYFLVGCTKLSLRQFFDIISSAKNWKEVCFRNVSVTFDEDQDFVEMSGCKICSLKFTHITFPNSKLNWFENIIAAISRCSELSNSLKTIYISWVISKSEAQEILKKYSLNEIQIIE